MASSQVLPTLIKSLLSRCEPFLVLKNRAGTKKYTFHLCFVLLFLMLWPNNWDEVTQEERAYFDWQSSRSDSNMGRHAHSGEWGGWSIASMDRKQGLDGECDLAVKSQDPAPSGQLSPMKHPPSLKSFTTLPKSISITIWEWDIQTHEPVGIIPHSIYNFVDNTFYYAYMAALLIFISPDFTNKNMQTWTHTCFNLMRIRNK